MGKSGKKARESHRQGRGRRASHFADEDGDVLPSSAYDAPPRHQDGSSDEDDTNEAAAEDEQEGEAEAGDQDLRQAGSMPSKFQLYQLSVQVTRVASIVACICGSLRAHHLFDDIPMRVMCLCLVTKGGHQLPAEVLPDVCGRTCSSPPARGFLWHSPSQVKSLSMFSFKKITKHDNRCIKSSLSFFTNSLSAMCMCFIVTSERMPGYLCLCNYVYTFEAILHLYCLSSYISENFDQHAQV
jgi:hypothetical protein